MDDYKGTCSRCGRKDVEVCGGDHCRDCHISISWDECVNETSNARMMLQNGWARDRVLELYPDADI